jgi:hypothetical protein
MNPTPLNLLGLLICLALWGGLGMYLLVDYMIPELPRRKLKIDIPEDQGIDCESPSPRKEKDVAEAVRNVPSTLRRRKVSPTLEDMNLSSVVTFPFV